VLINMESIKDKIYNIQKTKTVRPLGEVSIEDIKDDVLNITEELWDRENDQKPNKFQEFHSTKHIVFKFVKDMNDCRTSYYLPLWEEWKERLWPILQAAVKDYDYEHGEFCRIMLARLSANSQISIHKDGNAAATFPHKIHIPIQTNDECSFFINPDTYHFEEGKAYEVNNLTHHMAENNGDIPRIHLIFEYYSKSILEKALRDTVA